ncbi:MAG: HupE/UreJ family protein [Alphaproteobacteria bacterium]
MTRKTTAGIVLGFAASLAWNPALAHTYGADGAGLAMGFMHPIMGADHVLAMIAVGLWAAQRGGADLWRLPAAFVGTMALGMVLALADIGLPMVELGIAGSVVMLGALVGLAARIPSAAAVSLVALFALFHGHAHGTELPETAVPTLYALGFVAATALLHGVGAGAGLFAKRFGARAAAYAPRAGGAVVALAGTLLAAA